MKFTYAFLAVFYQAGTNCINFEHYVRLYEAEKDSHLKIVPKFTSSHVKPSKLEKMNVRLATQVPNRCRTFSFYSSFLNDFLIFEPLFQLFSRSVAIGLKFYREQREPGLKDSEGTEMFTMQVNDLFDVLNAKHPATGIRKNSPKIKVMGVRMLIVLYYEVNIFKGAFVCHATGDRRLPGHAE